MNVARAHYKATTITLSIQLTIVQLHTGVQQRAEAVGCPGPTRFLDALKNIFYSSRKISDDLFYQLSNFRTIHSLDAPSRAASCPGNDIFLFIFWHLPTFFYIKLAPWMPHRVDARGRRTVRTTKDVREDHQ